MIHTMFIAGTLRFVLLWIISKLVQIIPLLFIPFSSPELYDLYYYELYPNWIRIGINYTNTNLNSIFWVVWIREVLIILQEIILYDKRRHWSHYPDTPFNLVSGGFFFILIPDINILPCICSSSFIVSSAKISLASSWKVSRQHSILAQILAIRGLFSTSQ